MGKRRSFSPEFKVQVVLGLLSGSESTPKRGIGAWPT